MPCEHALGKMDPECCGLFVGLGIRRTRKRDGKLFCFLGRL